MEKKKLTTLQLFSNNDVSDENVLFFLLVAILTILNVAYPIVKLFVYFVFFLTKNQPNYVVRS